MPRHGAEHWARYFRTGVPPVQDSCPQAYERTVGGIAGHCASDLKTATIRIDGRKRGALLASSNGMSNENVRRVPKARRIRVRPEARDVDPVREHTPPQEIVSFVIPEHALAAIDPIAIIGEARRAGVSGLRIGVNDRGASASESSVTCGVVMAVRLVQAIERASTIAANKCDDVLSSDLAVAYREARNALGTRAPLA